MTEHVPEHLLDLAPPFVDAGWSKSDFLHALNNPPDGKEAVWGNPLRWEVAQARLALWLDESGRPMLSRAQQIARAASVKMRAQAQARADRAERAAQATTDVAGAAERARQVLAQASPWAARALDRRVEKTPAAEDPERWRLVDEAAAAAVVAGARSEVVAPVVEEPPGADPVEAARRERHALAVARARWERGRRRRA